MSSHPPEILWVGSTGGMEEALVAREGILYRSVSTGKLRGANPIKAARTLSALFKGVRQSLAILRQWRPDVCFVTGGYVCAPVVMACALRRTPVIIYLPDMTPGWTIRWMSRVARRVAITHADAAHYFGGLAPRGKAVVTGYPVRQELVELVRDRAASRRTLARELERPLDELGVPLLLVWGGSQGSRNINQSTWGALAQILPCAHVLHVVGTRDWPLYQARTWSLPPELEGRYHPVAYLHEEMVLALAAADISLARAGASTLGEFPVARLPSILAPLVGVNQMANAEKLAQAGGAVIVSDEELSGALAQSVIELVHDRPRRLAMEAALAQLATPDAAQRIAHEIVDLASDGDSK